MKHKTDIATDSVGTEALVVDGPQPVWMTLNQAREQAFTGEIVFETDPEVLAYLDNGIVYFAERVADAPLGQRLIDAGVVDAAQFERGLVRIGDLEHLGRLFDRDPSIDRDAVVVTAELFTEELIAELANESTANVRVAAYRHHPSGLHRWFVAPVDQAVVARQVGAIGQLDGTVVNDLPGLPYGLDDDEFMIEWDTIGEIELEDVEPDDEFVTDSIEESDVAEESVVAEDFEIVEEIEIIEVIEEIEIISFVDTDEDALELSLDLAEFVDDADDEVELPDFELVDVDFSDLVIPEGLDEVHLDDVEMQVSEPEATDDIVVTETGASESDDFEFSVVWPDGSEQQADGAAVDTDEAMAGEPTFTETDDGELQFSMPPLTLSDGPEQVDAEVPDDVADAVRRAIAAIESASVGESEVETDDVDLMSQMSEVDVSDVSDVDVADMEFSSFDAPEVQSNDTIVDAPAAPADGSLGFAPPTMATRAEVLYGQMSDDGALVDEQATMPTLADQTPLVGAVAAGGPSGHGGERTSALRRLIVGLRRKDH